VSASLGKAMSAFGFIQPASVKVLTLSFAVASVAGSSALAAVVNTTWPSCVTSVTAGVEPTAVRKTTNTEPRGSNSIGTRTPPSAASKAATGTICPLSACHNSGTLPATRNTGQSDAECSLWLDRK